VTNVLPLNANHGQKRAPVVDQLMGITGVKPLQAHPFNVSAYIYRSFNTQKTLFLVDIQLFKFITLFENCEYLGKIENRE
jgi:hypothetical protein